MTRQVQSDVVAFTLNDRQVRADDSAGLTLLDVLRDRLGVTSSKNGCQPAGPCGCCTVLVDGVPQFACRTAPAAIAGKHITTFEGPSEQDRRLLAKGFVRSGAVQCRNCTPGIAMRTYAWLERNPDPLRAEIAAVSSCTLFRCSRSSRPRDPCYPFRSSVFRSAR